MDPSVLRSRLVFLVGDDLKNLTISDLKECNFRTSRLVFSSLVFASRTLHEESERLTLINDSRIRKLGLLRNQSDCREERKRVEEEYRHSFYEIILKALLDLQFPPALEPFSDPLGSLKDDIDFRLSAIQYLLENTVVGAGSMTDMSVLSIQSKESSQSISQSEQNSPRGFSFDDSNTKRPVRRMSSKSKQRNSQSQHDNQRLSNDSISVVHNDDASPTSDYPPPPSCNNSNLSDIHMRPPSATGRGNSRRDNDRLHQGQENNQKSIQDNYLSEYEVLQQSYEILQHHNEQLSKQLKGLQAAVCQRNAMEVKMDLLMRDFSSMVNEIADISTMPEQDSQAQEQKFSPPSTPPKQAKSRPLGSVLEESASVRRKRPASGNQVSGKHKHELGTSGSSLVHWKQLQGRIQNVHTRWKSMRREAKNIVLGTVSMHINTSQSGNGYGQRSTGAFGSLQQQQSTPGKDSRQGSRGAVSTARSSFGDTGRRGSSSSRATGRSFTPSKKGSFEGMNSCHEASSGPIGAPSASISLHKILGVRVPLTFNETRNDDKFDTDRDGSDDTGLDISRVHQLQRDLVTFSRNAYSFSELSQFSEDDDHSLDGQKSRLQNRLSRFQTLSNLRQSANVLLLHTACLCPMLPLSCASPSLASNQTGLDILIQQIQPVLESKKLWTPSIQSSVDRARSEQYTLLVSNTHNDMRLAQWQRLAGQLNPAISNFADRLTSVCANSVQQVKERSTALLSLVSSLSQAESVRMALPDSNSPSVSPVEALSRGYFGEDMADLINRLRINAQDLSQLGITLDTAQKQIMSGIAAEIGTLVHCGDALGELSSS